MPSGSRWSQRRVMRSHCLASTSSEHGRADATSVPGRRVARGARHRHRVLIAGGGVGGLEAMLALRDLAIDRVAITVLSPDERFSLRARSVQDAFGVAAPRSYHLPDLCTTHGTVYVRDTLVHVGQQEHRVTTRSGRQDVLRLAPRGGRRTAATRLPPAEQRCAVRGTPRPCTAWSRIWRAATAGASPSSCRRGVTWPLPLYELALMAAERAYSQCLDVALTLITPEQEPLGMFGAPASEVVRHLMQESGITLRTATNVTDVRSGHVLLHNGHAIVRAQRVVTAPIPAGRSRRDRQRPPGLCALSRSIQ